MGIIIRNNRENNRNNRSGPEGVTWLGFQTEVYITADSVANLLKI